VPDLRASILAEVLSIEPFDATERLHQQDCINWINSGCELCRIEKPDVPAKHLISYFVIVDDDSTLLVDHKNARLWLPPGGHVNPGEHPRDTVIREAREELGLIADFKHQGPIFITCTETVGLTAGHVDVSLWYVLKATRKQMFEYDDTEFTSIQWFTPDDIPKSRTDPHMGRFLDKLAAL